MPLIDVQLTITKTSSTARISKRASILQPRVGILAAAFVPIAIDLRRLVLVMVGVVRPVVSVGTVIAIVLVDVHNGAFASCVVVCGNEAKKGEEDVIVDDLFQLLANAHCEVASTNREVHSDLGVCKVYEGLDVSSLACLRV